MHQYTLDQYEVQKAGIQDQIAYWDDQKAAQQILVDADQAHVDAINLVRQGIQDQITGITDQTTAITDHISVITRRYAEEHAQQKPDPGFNEGPTGPQ